MPRRSGYSHRRNGGPRRVTEWAEGVQEVDGAITASVKQLWSAAVAVTATGVTIVRTRGYVRAHLNSADAVGAGFAGAFGIGLAQTDALAIGVTALPGPVSDLEWEGWLWHQFFDIRAVTATIADGVNAASASQFFEIDSKAMRKFEDGVQLFGITEATEDTNATMEVQADTRMLIKPF